MKILIKNVYSEENEFVEYLKDEIILDVDENLSISELPEWLVKISKDYEPKLLEKIKSFVNLIKDKVLDPHDFCAFGINYYENTYGSYTLIFSKA